MRLGGDDILSGMKNTLKCHFGENVLNEFASVMTIRGSGEEQGHFTEKEDREICFINEPSDQWMGLDMELRRQ